MFNLKYLETNPNLEPIENDCLEISAVQFGLDCSTMPPVVTAFQQGGESILFDIFKMTRNYCHGLYKARKAKLESEYVPNILMSMFIMWTVESNKLIDC
jgi:hypothetical protein